MLDKSNNSEREQDSRTVSPIPTAKLLKGVEKSYEKGKYILDNSSKVVDENGEPLAIAHSTDKELYANKERGQKYLLNPSAPSNSRHVTEDNNSEISSSVRISAPIAEAQDNQKSLDTKVQQEIKTAKEKVLNRSGIEPPKGSTQTDSKLNPIDRLAVAPPKGARQVTQ